MISDGLLETGSRNRKFLSYGENDVKGNKLDQEAGRRGGGMNGSGPG